jgi:hypothetical protein
MSPIFSESARGSISPCAFVSCRWSCHPQHQVVVTTITPHGAPCHQVVVSSQREPEQSDDFTTATTNTNNLGAMLTQPSPFLPSLPLGYPVALLFTSALLCSLPAAILLHAAFVMFFLLGQQVSGNSNDNNDPDNDTSPVNIFAFAASLASAGLLAPSELYTPTGDRLVGACATAGLALVCASVMMEHDGTETEIDVPLDLDALNEWDQKMADQEESG